MDCINALVEFDHQYMQEFWEENSTLLDCSVLLWPTSSSREDYPMKRGKFYALSVLFLIFVFTSMTHFSERLSDGATIFKHVRHVNMWILMS